MARLARALPAALLALSVSTAAQFSAPARHPGGLRRLDPPARPGSMAPNLALDGDGKSVLLTWLEPAHPRVRPQDGDYALRFSRLESRRWSAPATISAGKDFFANWADFPSVTSSADGRMLLAHWAAKSSEDTYAYDVQLARSRDRGRTWIPMGAAHDDRTATEHGFVSAAPEGDGVRLFWLDGRATASGGPMALRSAHVADAVGVSELLDPKVCDCCQTSAAATRAGAAVFYRDRSDREARDVAFVRRMGEGRRWTAPRPVHADGWVIDGCPVNGPAVASSRTGDDVVVAWFTQAQNRPRVLAAFSRDGGATFASPFALDAADPLGRVDAVLDGNGDALVSWVASAPGKAAEIRLARIASTGRIGAAVAIASTDAGRSSGFPRIERAGDTLAVAWVEASDPFRLRAATLPVGSLPR